MRPVIGFVGIGNMGQPMVANLLLLLPGAHTPVALRFVPHSA